MFKTFHIFTLGCQMNVSDSERIEAVLEKCGLKPTDEKFADLIVVNSCSVRQKPIDRIWGKVRVWSRINSKAKRILTGCILPSDLKKLENKFDFYFRIENLDLLENYLTPHNRDEKNKMCHSVPRHGIYSIDSRWSLSRATTRDGNDIGSIKTQGYFEIKPKRKNRNMAYLPIMTGCNNFCSYCVVPYTRGREWSRNPQAIVEEVSCLIKKGHKEIMLLGQNVCSYSYQQTAISKQQNKNGFVKLLGELIQISGDFKISFMSPHPKDFSDELIDLIAKEPKIVKQIHLPLQSGDDKILKKMNRYYTTTQYLKLVDKLRNKIGEVEISTDIIVGFPGESKKSFQKTLNLAKKCRFYKAYVSIYSPRRGTMADKKFKDNVSMTEKKKRWLVLERLINQKSKISNTKF